MNRGNGNNDKKRGRRGRAIGCRHGTDDGRRRVSTRAYFYDSSWRALPVRRVIQPVALLQNKRPAKSGTEIK